MIEELWADLNSLSNLDLSNSSALTDLRLNHNDLTSIDISKSPQLSKLEINETPLKDEIRNQLSQQQSIQVKV